MSKPPPLFSDVPYIFPVLALAITICLLAGVTGVAALHNQPEHTPSVRSAPPASTSPADPEPAEQATDTTAGKPVPTTVTPDTTPADTHPTVGEPGGEGGHGTVPAVPGPAGYDTPDTTASPVVPDTDGEGDGPAALDMAAGTGEVLLFMNTRRVDNGSGPLPRDMCADETAQMWAQELADTTSFSAHPDPGAIFTATCGQPVSRAAQNVAAGMTVSDWNLGWWDHPESRDLMLGDWDRVGIGLAWSDSDNIWYAVVTFIAN